MFSFWQKIIASKSKILFCCLILFIAGVAAGIFFVLPHFFIFCLLLILIGAAVFFGLSDKNYKLNRNCFYVFLFLCLCVFGFWRYSVALPDYSDLSKIYHYSSTTATFFGRIDKVEAASGWQNLIMESRSLIQPASAVKISGRVQASTPLFPEYRPGDLVKVECRLKSPPSDNPGYNNYLFKDSIFIACDFGEIYLAKVGGWSAQLFFYDLRQKFGQAINSSVSEPAAGLLNGILINSTRGIPADLNQIFSDLGLTHIIAISGSHIVIIVAIIMSMLIFFGISRPKAFWPAAAIILFYIILIGAPASAVRSAVMALVVMYAQKIGRLTASANALLLAASVMVLINPKILLFDVGFQLSFMAVAGLIYVNPILKSKLVKLPEFGPLKEIFITTLSAQLMTLPLLMYYFSKLSLISLVANLLILPIIPLLMTWGFIQMFVATVFLPLGQICGYLSWLLITYWVTIAKWLHAVPFGFMALPSFSWWWLVLFYLVIFIILNYFKRRGLTGNGF